MRPPPYATTQEQNFERTDQGRSWQTSAGRRRSHDFVDERNMDV